MEVKKYPKPEVKNKRIDFFLTGLAFSLLVVFGAFSYTIYDDRPDQLENIIIEEDLVVMENTVQKINQVLQWQAEYDLYDMMYHAWMWQKSISKK